MRILYFTALIVFIVLSAAIKRTPCEVPSSSLSLPVPESSFSLYLGQLEMGHWKCLLGRRAVRNLVDRHLVVSGWAGAVVGVAGSSIGDPAGVLGRNQYCPFLSIGDPAGVLVIGANSARVEAKLSYRKAMDESISCELIMEADGWKIRDFGGDR